MCITLPYLNITMRCATLCSSLLELMCELCMLSGVTVKGVDKNKYLQLEQGAKVEVAHREGRTRSLQIAPTTCGRKSLTLYPIELGGRYLPSLTYIHVLTLYTH